MKTSILFIDTAENTKVTVGLIGDGTRYEMTQEASGRRDQAVLPLVRAILNEQKLGLHDLTGIHVNNGPGSFTGVRVGVAIANTLGVVLGIPINNLPVGEVVEPRYE